MSGIQPTKVRRAFIDDRANVRAALVISFDGDELQLTALDDGSAITVVVADPAAVFAVIDESTATRHRGHRLALVHPTHRLIGLAFGPPGPPGQLTVTGAVGLDDSSIPPLDDQPGWRLFDLLEPRNDAGRP